MKEIRILYLYPDILDLYGDVGNIKVLEYRLEKRGMKAIIDTYSLEDNAPDFSSYDIVFAGGGAESEQKILLDDLMQYKENIKEAVENGVFFLLISSSYQLFGKYYKDAEENINPCLEIFDYYSEAIKDKQKKCIGDIVIETEINGEETKVIGFENHGNYTFNVKEAFGNVLYGNGNKFGDLEEGFKQKNVIATYMHGPLLSKNPKIADYIIEYALNRKYNEDIELEKLDDEFEEKCREQLLNKFMENI